METEFKIHQVERSFQKFGDYSRFVYTSDYISFPNWFDIWIDFCENDEVMGIITTQLKQMNVSYEEWFTKLEHFPNGNYDFRLPLNEIERIALLYRICLKIYDNEIQVAKFVHNFNYSLNYNDSIRFFNFNILKPLIDVINYKIKDISNTLVDEYKGKVNIPINILYVFNNLGITIGNNNEFNAETVIGRGANLEK